MFRGKSSNHGILVILFCICHISVRSSTDIPLTMMAKFSSGEPAYLTAESVVPFDLQSHRILVPVSINGSKTVYTFLLDTGAMTCIDENLAVELDLKRGDIIQTLRKDKPAYLTMIRTIGLGHMEVRNFIVPRMDIGKVFDDSFQYSGFLGADFLRFFSVTIDYREHTLTLADTSVTYTSRNEQVSVPLTATLPMWFPYVQGTLNDSIHAPIMVDTGSPFSLVVPLSFEERLCVSPEMECIRSRGIFAKWPATDPPYNVYTRLHSLQIGDHVVNFLPALMTDLPMMVNTPLMGKAFIDKYLIRLDFPRALCHFIPLPDTDHETNVYTRGIRIRRADADSTVIAGVWVDSSADRKGLSPGERVLSIQGIDPARLTEESIDSILTKGDMPFVALRICGRQTEGDIHLSKDALFTVINR